MRATGPRAPRGGREGRRRVNYAMRAMRTRRRRHNVRMVNDWKRQIDRLHQNLVSRGDPAAWVTEADAVSASYRYPHIALRGPVFGIATHGPAPDSGWRMLKPATNGAPQQARDSLQSYLWFRAKDDIDDVDERRGLLAAVSVLEKEPVNEVEALGVRYRIVRGDEFARSGDDGLEPPRPTDVDAIGATWDARSGQMASDTDFLLDPAQGQGLMAGAMKAGLRGFCYSGSRFPSQVIEDSARAIITHPEVVLLPDGFGVVELRGASWQPRGSLMATPHDARLLLYGGMIHTWPLIYEFDEATREKYARAAEGFKAAGRADDVRVGESLFRICRIARLVRTGPDGPEAPRPSDQDGYGPMKMHPTMNDDGTIQSESESESESDSES